MLKKNVAKAFLGSLKKKGLYSGFIAVENKNVSCDYDVSLVLWIMIFYGQNSV